MFPEFSLQATKSLFKKDPIRTLSIFHTKWRGEMLLLLRVTPRKLRVFSGMFFFLLKTGWISTKTDEVTMLTDQTMKKTSVWAVNQFALVKLHGMTYYPIKDPDWESGSCYKPTRIPWFMSCKGFVTVAHLVHPAVFCVFVLGYHLLGSSSDDGRFSG